MKIKHFITLLFLFATAVPLLAQTGNVNPASVDVNNLSDSQIDRIIREIQSRGLSEDEAITLAKAQGASQTQIDQLTVRIQQRQMGGSDLTQTNNYSTSTGFDNTTSTALKPLSTPKALFKASKKSQKIFGFQLFNSDKLTFEPAVNIPVPHSYILGIGDQITVNVWGASQTTYQLKVDKNGSVIIPDVGPVAVAGLPFDRAKEMIRRKLTAIYSGMAEETPNTWAEVSIGTIRSIKVNVIGEINVPGTYTLPATASAFNALYLSGGPNEFGSFREIRLIRDGQTIKVIDVYDYIINGDPSADVQLRDQDILYVPTYKNRVETVGELKRKALFEVKGNETLADLIRFAGGFTENAYANTLSVTRNSDKEKEVKTVTQDQFGSFLLQNGDIVRTDTILNRFTNRVSINGAVFHPGNYELTQGMKLSDLIKKADGVKEEAYQIRGVIARLKEDHTYDNISFSLQNILKGNEDLPLQREDSVVIRSIYDMREAYTVNIMGQVQNPEQFSYRDNMTLGDLIFMAGGFLEDADITSIELSRRLTYDEAAKVSQKLNKIFLFNITRDLKMTPEDAAFKLEPFDEVYVRRAPGFRDQGIVTVNGEVTYTGAYSISDKDERISDIIERAGGLIPGAYAKGATLMRERKLSEAELQMRKQLMKKDSLLKDSLETKQIFAVGIELDKILANPGSEYDLLVQPGDELNIPRLLQIVKVSGSVMNPIAMTFDKKYSMREYISRAGGYADIAKRSKSYVLYPNGTTAAKKSWLSGSPRVTPGSEIIVPTKPEKKEDNTMKWVSVGSTVASLAISIATMISIAK